MNKCQGEGKWWRRGQADVNCKSLLLCFSLRTIQTAPLVPQWPWRMSWATTSGWTMTHWKGAAAAEWLRRKEAASWTLPQGKYQALVAQELTVHIVSHALRDVLAREDSASPSPVVVWLKNLKRFPERNPCTSSKNGLCDLGSHGQPASMAQSTRPASSLGSSGDGCCYLEITNWP